MFVATAYPSSFIPTSDGGMMAVDARVKAIFKGRARPTFDAANLDITAYDEMGLAQLTPSTKSGGGVAWFVELVDGSEGTEDPVSRSVDGRAKQMVG